MPRISSNLDSWSSYFTEVVRGPNPISFFNRIVIKDETCFFDRVWSLEPSRDLLRKKIQLCKEKAGFGGGNYPTVLEEWKKSIVSLSEEVEVIDREALRPSQASTKNTLGYNHEIAKAVTDKELNGLSRNTSKYLALFFVSQYLGRSKKADSTQFFRLIAETQKNPAKEDLAYLSKNLGWGFFQRQAYSVFFWMFSKIIHTVFQNVLDEMRLSTEGKVEPIFEGLLDHLEKFLKEYRGEKTLEDFTEKKDLSELCKELSPYLVNEFFPWIKFFKRDQSFLLSIPYFVLNFTLGLAFNLMVRGALQAALPGLLKQFSETVVESLTATTEESSEDSVNYRLAIPVMRFVNDKLLAFSNVLQEPSTNVDDPPGPQLADKLAGVIDELMKLSTNPSSDPEIQEGIRSGLIEGGHQLMKYWQKEQENLLQQVLVLAGLPFTESQDTPDFEADKKEYKAQWKKQASLVQVLCDRLFELEARKKAVGEPSSKVVHHYCTQQKRIKRYLEEGFSEIIGLKSSLQRAQKELQTETSKDYDMVLGKHLVFWEGFLSMMKDATKKHYPKPAGEILIREFYPLCDEAALQVSRVAELQDEWTLYTRHKVLKQRFYQMLGLFEVKKSGDLKTAQIQHVLNSVETLLPPNSAEVFVLRRFLEVFSLLKSKESLLVDLIRMKAVLKKQKHGEISLESLEEMKAFLSKHPEIQKEAEFAGLYKNYKLLCLGEIDEESERQSQLLHQMSLFMESKFQEHSQVVKDLQMDLLHRIHPQERSNAFQVPLPMNALLKELSLWIEQKAKGYELLEQSNMKELQEGTNDLLEHVGLLEEKVHQISPHRLYFPMESVMDRMEKLFGSLSSIPGISWKKQALIQDISGILEGVTPLITAKQEEGKRNLYSWIERLALYESVKYFKNKKRMY